MISFKQFLSEKAMNPSEFKKVAARQDSNTLAGFEIECVVQPESPLFTTESDDEADFISLRDIDSFKEFSNVFYIDPSTERELVRGYDEWSNDHDGEDSIYSDDFKKFVKYRGGFRSLASEHGLDPSFGWASDLSNDRSTVYTEFKEKQDDQERVYDAIAKSLNRDLGLKAIVPGDAKRTYKNNLWLVTNDESVEGDGMGVEIISPPTPLGKALDDLEKVFDWMDDNKIITNITTGFHINLSVPNIADVDLVKLVLFMGETHVMKQFDRLANRYSGSQVRSILNNLAGGRGLPSEASEMIKLADRNLSDSKYTSVNITKMKSGYLEFRIVGNSNYHSDFSKIKNTILRFVSALEIACDKDAERKLYLKKITALMGRVEDASVIPENTEKSIMALLSQYAAEEIPSMLSYWLEKAKTGKIKTPATKAKLIAWLTEDLFDAIKQAFKDASIKKPSDKQKAELKIILKRLGIVAGDIDFDDSALSWLKKSFNL